MSNSFFALINFLHSKNEQDTSHGSCEMVFWQDTSNILYIWNGILLTLFW